MNRIKDIVYYDFQGWPEYKMNLREVLMALGGKVEGDTISFDLKDPLMIVWKKQICYILPPTFFIPSPHTPDTSSASSVHQ